MFLMKNTRPGITCISLSSLLLFSLLVCLPAKEMTREEIIAVADRMADTQLASFHHGGRHWVDGVMWAGIMDFSKISMQGHQEIALQRLKKTKGELVFHNEKEPHHGDDFCVSQALLDLYEQAGESILIEDTIRRMDLATESILGEEMAQKAAKVDELDWQDGLTWYWCDALFMAAPVHARLSAMTGDPKYLKAMHVEWQRASDLLYDKEEHLYFRDKKFITKPSKNGEKMFWARGNGWVMGALARTIPYIPEDDPKRSWYVDQFKEISARLASLQQPDGTWSPSLLDYEAFPYSESTGTALNAFAMAWGINNGILDEKTYRPVVEKAWAALLAALREDGLLGYAQGVGAEPAPVITNQQVWYGNGAFLMAATQLAQMAPLNVPEIPPLTARPPAEPKN